MKNHFELTSKNEIEGWDKYPRPQFKRDSFYSLNGVWKVSEQKVLVPFPIQSEKSGFKGKIPKRFMYEKSFTLPSDFVKDKVFLNFGAVDQIAVVYVNGKMAGRHEGGYLSFQFDVTDLIDKTDENVIQVEVKDTLSHLYPYGKQKTRRGGMWYTPVSGIWKSVWLESTTKNYIKNIKITPDLGGINLKVDTNASGYEVEIKLENYSFKKTYKDMTGSVRIDIDNPHLWTCDNPVLYELTIRTIGDKGTDVIESYFALRTVSIKQFDGISRICLNDKPVFMNGVLDQGYFYDGIYTPSNENEYRKDILRMKELGFNMLRKHIKIEPEIFYYLCDKLGMLVLQDMVNNGHYSFMLDTVMPTFISKKAYDTIRVRSFRRKKIFVNHMIETINVLYNHPCIVGYTIFNEGWGQFDSDRLYKVAKKLDSSRFYDSTSGWFKQKKSDVDSEHVYFKNIKLNPSKDRPMILSECGGFQYKVKNHVFSKKIYGYGACSDSNELSKKIVEMYEIMVIPAIQNGLCGCIYTQLSDVEDEINGLYTYDRQVCKIDKELIKMINKKIEKIFQSYII